MDAFSDDRDGSLTPEEQMESYFDSSASQVRSYTFRFERSYARPALERGIELYNGHPLVTTVMTLFLLLNFIPIAVFICTSVFAVLLSILLAVASTSAAVVLAEFVLLSGLVCALVAVTGCASTATAFTAFTYLFFRFFALLWTDGPSGLTKWAEETRRHASRILRGVSFDVDQDNSRLCRSSAHDREMPAGAYEMHAAYECS
ncbi:hypothetical protein BD626DRAFT_562969 [Schizophyllum amplum]|uniref:Uncharacterized protein n=1 Tax=Schizophyllum amplum TaxID=97359 RepID=A0A550CWP4_9AGAR|nr:hypothetical protein BD626DRAFT_562969 [Auriculariopsis ampla]